MHKKLLVIFDVILVVLLTLYCGSFSEVQGQQWQTAEFINKVELPNCWARGVALKGHYLFSAGSEETKSLWVLDVADPARPKVVSTWGPYYGFPQEIAVQGNYAYVPDGSGMLVFDISDVTQPRKVGWVSLRSPTGATRARQVVVRGNYAYVATHDEGMAIVDISNPTSPVVVGRADVPGNTFYLAISGDYAYLAARDGGLQIVFVANPTAPVRVAEYLPPTQYPRNEYNPGSVTGVQVRGDFAFVLSLDYNSTTRTIQLLLTALDITDPANPQVYAQKVIPGTFGGGYYDNKILQITDDGHAFLIDWDTLTVMDVSNPGNMYVISTFSLPKEPTVIHAEGVQGEWVPRTVEGLLPWFVSFYYEKERGVGYLIDERWGLWTLDMTDLRRPRLLGAIPTAGEARIIRVFGQHAYLTDFNGGLFIFNMANPARPKLLGQYWSGDNLHNFHGSESGLLYIPLSLWNLEAGGRRGGILVLDVRNPARVEKAGVIRLPNVDGVEMTNVDSGTAVYLLEDKLYVCHRGVIFVYRTLGSNAKLLGYLTVVEELKHINPSWYDVTPHPQLYVRRCGKRVLAYMTSTRYGLSIVDVTDGENPRVIGQLNRPTHLGTYSNIDVQGNYAYITHFAGRGGREEVENGVWIIDVSDPENPRWVSVFATHMYDPRRHSGRPIYVRVQDDRAWVADYSMGVSVWDISDRVHPRLIDGPIRKTSVNQFSLDLNRDYLYRADVGALEVYRVLP